MRVLEILLRCYKRWFSPLLPAECKYLPTCSEYAAQAITCHGVLRGGALAAWRLLRCHPLARGGHDPVPACVACASHNISTEPPAGRHDARSAPTRA